MDNVILQTDSYKLTHWRMYPPEVKYISSYLEPRYSKNHIDYVKWFGLGYYLKRYLEGVRVTPAMVNEAQQLARYHFGESDMFNWRGWTYIVNEWGGRLPVRIYAADEGRTYDLRTPLMVIENTDPNCPWLVNALETLLMKVWYPTTVATISHRLKEQIGVYYMQAGDDPAGVKYALHDFGYRGVSSEESAALGGAAHLLNFMGTDTIAGMLLLRDYYGQPMNNLAHSVNASEHSVMTMLGPRGEIRTAERIIAQNSGKIVSIVADSYNYYSFIQQMIGLKELVKTYNVQLVIRPDSPTDEHPDAASLVLWTLRTLEDGLGATVNAQGYKKVPYKVLWGDGLEPSDILDVLANVTGHKYAPSNLVFGMGGGLLQKVNRDTFGFALKCSAQSEDGVHWTDVQKKPLDQSKASKRGRQTDGLTKVFENGIITSSVSPTELRFND